MASGKSGGTSHCFLSFLVAVALMGVLGALLGGGGISHGALGLRGGLDAALIAKPLARVLEEGDGWRSRGIESGSHG